MDKPTRSSLLLLAVTGLLLAACTSPTSLEAARRMMERCELFTIAESLGGVESLINHPALMTHASVPAERRAKLGVSDNLVRLSVGTENLEDLRKDIANAL